MAASGQITKELDIGELISRTFGSFRKNFAKYLIVYLIVEAIVGVLTTLAATAWSSAEIPTLVLSVILGIILGSIALGTTIRMASGEIQTGLADIRTSFRFATSKLLSIWALAILMFLAFFLGFLAVLVFSLVLPVLLIENTGVRKSFGRSRDLVDKRWKKTFAFLFIVYLIIFVATVVARLIGIFFGPVSDLATNLISAFYAPILPIALTVYYHSNIARLTPQPPQASGTLVQANTPQVGTKFCPNCGTQLGSSVMFCSKCGARQPAQ